MRIRIWTLAVLFVAALGAAAWSAEDPLEGWGRDSDYNKLFNAKTVQTVQGKVVAVSRHVHPLPTMGQGMEAVVETADGRKITCQVGPVWFTEYFHRQWNIQEGDQVEVRGSLVTVGGKPAMMVVWGRKGDLEMTVRNPAGVPVWDLDLADF